MICTAIFIPSPAPAVRVVAARFYSFILSMAACLTLIRHPLLFREQWAAPEKQAQLDLRTAPVFILHSIAERLDARDLACFACVCRASRCVERAFNEKTPYTLCAALSASTRH